MAYVWQRWLAEEFRAAGLTVIEIDGWKNRGRPASTGDYDPVEGDTIHHTGATTTDADPGPTLRTLIVGRPDLPGPLSQYTVRRDGVVVVIAAGRCNHAGRVGKAGVPGMPYGTDGNARAMGNEVDTDGRQALTPEQRHSIAVTSWVVLKHNDLARERAHRHEDISGTGKWDIGSLTTGELRADVADVAQDMEDDMPSPEEIARIVHDEVQAVVRAEVPALVRGEVEKVIDTEIDESRVVDPTGERKPWSIGRLLWAIHRNTQPRKDPAQ